METPRKETLRKKIPMEVPGKKKGKKTGKKMHITEDKWRYLQHLYEIPVRIF